MSYRKKDVELTNLVNNKLDETFYKTQTTLFERIEEKSKQLKGIDVIFTINGKKYVCDEKSAVTWRNLNTYSLEITTLNKRKEVIDGWLVNDDLINDSYLFIWLDNNNLTKPTKIMYNETFRYDKMVIALINKEKLLEYLGTIGWTIDNLKAKAEKIRNHPNSENMGDIKHNGCKFSFSKNLDEQPINILLPRQKFLDLADMVWEY